MLETNFSKNHEEMGLSDLGDNCYHYIDQFSEIKYMQLQTEKLAVAVPTFAIFVKEINADVDPNDPLEGFKYVGNISGSYKFVGNDTLAQNIRDSISSSGQAVFREYPLLSSNLTNFSNEIVIQHSTTVDQIGIIRPQINLTNSYNGTSLAKVSFGFSVNETDSIDDTKRIGFSFDKKMMTMKQVHVQSSQTLMTGVVSGYIDVFSDNISDLISQNFETEIPEEDSMKVLDMIEKSGVGKNRSKSLNEFLINIPNKTIWNIFHAITRFSTMESNLNAKRLLENVAEAVLVVPGQMRDAISNFNQTVNETLRAA